MRGSAYADLEIRFRRLHLLGEAAGMLHWDQATMMPAGSAESRAEQLAELAAVRHGLLTATDVGDLLEAASEEDGLGSWQAANLREMRRKWQHATALNEAQVVALSRACSTCETKWRQVRGSGSFADVLAEFGAVLVLVRETAVAKSERLQLEPYDALVDQYEAGLRAERIDPIFDRLAGFLPGFLARVIDKQEQSAIADLPEGPFPVDRQRRLAEHLMRAIGFDFDKGHLDTSAHPFCGGSGGDIRITTRFDESDFSSAMMAVLHETGHALYEMGLPADWRLQPIGQSLGMAIHESQSLLIEMQVCRSRPFAEFMAPQARDVFAATGPEWQAENLHRALIHVAPGFIRVDADEVTYPAHVILRYRLERAMIGGDLVAADLPQAWNDGMRDLLGLVPPSDREGCLQDIHWFDGAWGYFPTYTLGAIAAAQIFDTARQEQSGIPDDVSRDDFSTLRDWLSTKVHGRGRYLDAEGLLNEVTGRGFDVDAFIRHLERRYLCD